MLLFDLHNVIRKIAQSYLGLKQLTEEDDDGEAQPPILSNIDYKIILFSIFHFPAVCTAVFHIKSQPLIKHLFQGSLTGDTHFLIPGLQKAIVVADRDANWKLKDILLSSCELLGRYVDRS